MVWTAFSFGKTRNDAQTSVFERGCAVEWGGVSALVAFWVLFFFSE